MLRNVELRQDFFEVSWKISELCNMNCPYCVIKNKTAFPDKDLIKQIASRINELILLKKKTYSVIYITGGEPFLQDLEDIIPLWLDNPYLKWIRITSNMSLPSERYLKVREIIESNGKNFLLKSSYHNGSFTDFVNKCKTCKSDFINLVCNDNNYRWYKDELNKFPEYDNNKTLGDININWMVERLTGGGIPDTVKTIPRRSSTFSMDNGCTCSAGHTTIRIDPFGEIKRCFSSPVEGNILKELKLFPERYRCNRKTCSGCQNIFVYDESEIKYFHR